MISDPESIMYNFPRFTTLLFILIKFITLCLFDDFYAASSEFDVYKFMVVPLAKLQVKLVLIPIFVEYISLFVEKS